ncbi:MAG: riboflavin synthase [Actinobacteria bacterium]|nr:riboflavin synthase [Actinomycetota bacterium]
MFTGLIAEVGKVQNITHLKDSVKIEVSCNNVTGDLKIGDSISVNGACLTTTNVTDSGFTADVMKKTLELTALVNLKAGDLLNLELAMRFIDRFGGHLVQGHVDATAEITEILPSMKWTQFQIKLPNHLLKYVVPQGSICLDGVSLTIGEITGQLIAVWLIPETLKRTNLASKKVGDLVNVEVDLLAKYVERLTRGGQSND